MIDFDGSVLRSTVSSFLLRGNSLCSGCERNTVKIPLVSGRRRATCGRSTEFQIRGTGGYLQVNAPDAERNTKYVPSSIVIWSLTSSCVLTSSNIEILPVTIEIDAKPYITFSQIVFIKIALQSCILTRPQAGYGYQSMKMTDATNPC